MTAAFAHDLWKVRHDLSAGRAEEIAIGFVMAFIASVVVVRPFVRQVLVALQVAIRHGARIGNLIVADVVPTVEAVTPDSVGATAGTLTGRAISG